ncbi:MAG: translocation/assembly module TamB [Cyclobacteriaceae bacterium]|nr:translocation/assembly module TamB [Cyclobacteriaceae bacterium]
MNLQVIKNRTRKILAYFLASIIFLLASAFLILQIPPVQQRLISHYLTDFNSIVGFKTSIKKFRLLWFDRLELEGVLVLDKEGNKMIAAKSIRINYTIAQLLGGPDVHIDGIILDSAAVYLTKIHESDTSRNLNINVFINEINEHYAASKNPGSRTQRIKIGEAFISQSKFSLIDQDKEPIENGFNYNQFTLDIDEGQLQNFLILGDTTEFNVTTLIATDQETNFSIRQLSTFFRISQQAMEFIGLNLKAGESTVSDTIIFTYKSQLDLDDFNSKVKIHANLKDIVLYPRDLALFVPGAEQLNKPLKINGIFNGRVNRFVLKNMEVGMGNTELLGSLEMEGLPDITETFINLNLQNSLLDFNDLQFVFNENTLTRLNPLGKINMNGQFVGYTNDFVANGSFFSNIGKIKSDINFKVNEGNFDKSNYSGNLTLENFDLGLYLSDTVTFQLVNLDGKLKGSGLTVQTADFTLNGKVSSLGIKKYNYTNIATNARFASEFFSGIVTVDDPNLKLTAEGSVDLRNGSDILKIQAQLDTALLHNLNLSKDRIFLHSKLNINTSGLQLDSLAGEADLEDFRINFNDQWLVLDKIHLTAERTKTSRTVNFQSTLIDAMATGDFNFSDVLLDAQTLQREILLNISNDKYAIHEYYANKKTSPKKYEARFEVNLKNIKPLIELFKLDMQLANNTKIEGRFTSGYTSIFQAYTRIESVTYQQKKFSNTEIDLTASKISDSTSVLANALITSAHQDFGSLNTKNLTAEGIWNNNHIDFLLDVDQAETKNFIRLGGAVNFLKDSTQLTFQPSIIHLLEKDWAFDPSNSITFIKKEITVRDLKLQYENQYMLVDGNLSENPEKILTAKISAFDLSFLNTFLTEKISGVLNASLDVSNYYHEPFIQNNLFIKAMTLNDFLIGDVRGNNQWDTVVNRFNINLTVDRNETRIINAMGSYNPSQQVSPINVDAEFTNANLKIIEPFFDDLFSRWDGTLSGNYHITGSLKSPLINGEGEVKDGQMMINYLKTLYRFTGTVGLSPNSIFFRNIELTDALRNNAKLNGTITHEGFRDMRINLDANYQNFQVMNTTAKDNSLFYGQAYASGDLTIFGPLSNLKISAHAKSEKNTRIYIPISGSSSSEKKDFINFVNFSDSTFQSNLQQSISKKLALTGLSLDFNLDITPDAYCEILIDMKAGDIIRGRGNGDIQLQIDTNGDFSMFGPFVFTEGWYNFTLYDIINKEFEIKKGSTITWYGDPYAAILNINAAYNQLASFGPIITNQELAATPQMRRKYPVEVLLKLEGPMLAPQINFDILADQIPKTIIVEGAVVDLAFQFQAFKNKMDEQELKRQVFSLIVLRKFSPPDAFNASGSLVNSVSELFSNQLSNWATQVDENLEVDVDLGQMDQEAFNTFQLRLSYSFFNGRLRVTSDGTYYGQGSNNTSTTNASSLAGDWSVDYMLTADGKFRAKMYSRTNVNPILNTINSQNSLTTGASLMYTQSFNEFKDLLKKARDKQRKSKPVSTGTNGEAIKEEDGAE